MLEPLNKVYNVTIKSHIIIMDSLFKGSGIEFNAIIIIYYNHRECLIIFTKNAMRRSLKMFIQRLNFIYGMPYIYEWKMNKLINSYI